MEKRGEKQKLSMEQAALITERKMYKRVFTSEYDFCILVNLSPAVSHVVRESNHESTM